MIHTNEEIEAHILGSIRRAADLPDDYPIPIDVELFGPRRCLLDQVELDSMVAAEVLSDLSDEYSLMLEGLPSDDVTTVHALTLHVRGELTRVYGDG